MALKYKYARREEIPAEVATLYIEREGAFMLDAEGVTEKAKADELRNHNIELRRKLEEFTTRFEGIDPEAARNLAEEKRKLEEAQQLKAGEVDKVVETRLIDSHFRFEGIRAVTNQALAWPRSGCPDKEQKSGTRYVPMNQVPADVVGATCETARALIVEDRTANPSGEGLKFLSIGDLQQSFDKHDRPPVLPHVAQALLAKYGASAQARSGSVRLERA